MFDMYDEIYSNTDKVLDETMELLQEANVVRMDKATRKKRLLTATELTLAKESGDKLFEKYAKATKIRRKCRKLIHKKYESKAKVRVKQYLQARNSSK